jgi:hypothetical protein
LVTLVIQLKSITLIIGRALTDNTIKERSLCTHLKNY